MCRCSMCLCHSPFCFSQEVYVDFLVFPKCRSNENLNLWIVFVSVCLSIRLSCLPVYLFVRLSACLSVCLFVCLSTNMCYWSSAWINWPENRKTRANNFVYAKFTLKNYISFQRQKKLFDKKENSELLD